MKIFRITGTVAIITSFFLFAGFSYPADFELKLTTMMVKPHPFLHGAEHLAKRVQERTNGRVKIAIYEGGKLGPDNVTLTGLQEGTIDFNWTGAAQTASYIPELNFFGLSYLFKSREHLEKAIRPDGFLHQRTGKLIEEKKLGFKFLALSGGGIRNMSNRLRPVRSMNDLKGMKMRVPGSKTMVQLWKAYGAMPTTIDWTELYSALQAGVIDAFESSTAAYRSSKLFEVAKYHTKTEHEIGVTLPLMSRKTYDRLPADLRKVVEEAMTEAAAICTRVGFEQVQQDLEWFAAKGVIITEVDKGPFINLTVPIQDETAKQYRLEDALQEIRNLAK